MARTPPAWWISCSICPLPRSTAAIGPRSPMLRSIRSSRLKSGLPSTKRRARAPRRPIRFWSRTKRAMFSSSSFSPIMAGLKKACRSAPPAGFPENSNSGRGIAKWCIPTACSTPKVLPKWRRSSQSILRRRGSFRRHSARRSTPRSPKSPPCRSGMTHTRSRCWRRLPSRTLSAMCITPKPRKPSPRRRRREDGLVMMNWRPPNWHWP